MSPYPRFGLITSWNRSRELCPWATYIQFVFMDFRNYVSLSWNKSYYKGNIFNADNIIQRNTLYIVFLFFPFRRDEEEGTRWKKGTEDGGANGLDRPRPGGLNRPNPGWKKVEAGVLENQQQNVNLNLAPKSSNSSGGGGGAVTPAGLPPLPPQKLVFDTPTVSTEAR